MFGIPRETTMATALVDKERVLKLLGSGLSSEIVATTIGCDPSFISQLMADDSFRERVVALRTESLAAASARDTKIDDLEERLLDQLSKVLDFIVKPGDLLRAFQTVNSAKRRGVPLQETTVINNTVVNLNIPPVVLPQFRQNGLGEVIEVEGRPLLTIDSADLLRKVAGDHPDLKKRAEMEKLASQLPASIRAKLATKDSSSIDAEFTRIDHEQFGLAREN